MRIAGKHTVRRPRRLARGERAARAGHRRDLADLEPHIAGPVPGIDVAALGHPRHVERQGTEVGHGRHGDEPQLVARRDGGRRGAGLVLEAADVLAVDVRHALVALEVLGLADRDPFLLLGDAVDDELGEAVCWVSCRHGRTDECGLVAVLTMGISSGCHEQQRREDLHLGYVLSGLQCSGCSRIELLWVTERSKSRRLPDNLNEGTLNAAQP